MLPYTSVEKKKSKELHPATNNKKYILNFEFIIQIGETNFNLQINSSLQKRKKQQKTSLISRCTLKDKEVKF